jgi:hypothetical protein
MGFKVQGASWRAAGSDVPFEMLQKQVSGSVHRLPQADQSKLLVRIEFRDTATFNRLFELQKRGSGVDLEMEIKGGKKPYRVRGVSFRIRRLSLSVYELEGEGISGVDPVMAK